MMAVMAGRIQIWVGTGVTVVAVAGLGVYFVMAGLDRADKAASVVGGLVAVIGLAVAVYGAVTTSAPGRRISQVAEASGHGRVKQVGGHQYHEGSGRLTDAVPGWVEQRGAVVEDGEITQIGGDQSPGSPFKP